MGRTILAAAFLLLPCVAHAQELKKGNLVGTHLVGVTLEPGVTMEQFADIKKVIPEVEKSRTFWPPGRAVPERREIPKRASWAREAGSRAARWREWTGPV